MTKDKYEKLHGMYREFMSHECGYEVENLLGRIEKGKICPGCGGRITQDEIETFAARFEFQGNWYNPFTWFKYKLEKKK